MKNEKKKQLKNVCNFGVVPFWSLRQPLRFCHCQWFAVWIETPEANRSIVILAFACGVLLCCIMAVDASI